MTERIADAQCALEEARAVRDRMPHGAERRALNVVLDVADAAISAAMANRPVAPAECHDSDSPWLVCNHCHAAGKCDKQAAPTEAMELAGMRALRNTHRTVTGEYSREQARACWDAMVAAAPQQEPGNV